MDEIINALHLRNWYALAALTLTLAVQIFRKAPRSRALWDKIPDGYRWLLPVLSGAVTGFTQAFAAGLALPAAILSALGGAIGISIPAMGINSLLTEAPVKWNGGAGGAPPKPKEKEVKLPPFFPGGAAFLFALSALGFALHLACTPAHTAADVPHDIAIAYTAATVALEVAYDAEAAYLDSLQSPTTEQVDRAAAVIEKLKQARITLDAVRADFKSGRAKILSALSDLQSGIELAKALGIKVPDKVSDSIATATKALQ